MNEIDFKIERLVLKTGNAINNIRINDLKVNDLTPAQSETILYYSDHGGSNIKDLSTHLKVTHQAARKLVDKLKSKGILTSSVSPDDRRFARVHLTDSGSQLCDRLKESGTLTGENILLGFSADEKHTLLKYLQRIEKNIDTR